MAKNARVLRSGIADYPGLVKDQRSVWRQCQAMEPARKEALDGDRPALSAKSLVKRFGGVAAVDGVSIDVRRGEIVGLIGPNGAGKTTLFDLIAGELKPTSGGIRLDGAAVESGPAACAAGARPRPHLPDPAPVSRDDADRERDAGRAGPDRRAHLAELARAADGGAGGARLPRQGDEPARFRHARPARTRAGAHSFRRSAQAARTRPRADGRPGAAPARRAGRRRQSEPARGDCRTHRRDQPARRRAPRHRAQHGRDRSALRARLRHGGRQASLRRAAGGGGPRPARHRGLSRRRPA